MTSQGRISGMKAFYFIWTGQFISILGSAMTGLGIPIWVYTQTERATDLTVMAGLWMASLLVVSPLTGVLVDRHNKKFMMMISDLTAGLVTILTFILYSLGMLEIWHLYIFSVIQGASQSFQWPAFSAAISMMVPKEQYQRTATLNDLSGTGAAIIAPLAAGAILGFLGNDTGLRTILLIDIITFSAAIGTLLMIYVPEPERTEAQEEAQKGGFLGELSYGFRYIFSRRSLLGVQSVFMVGNLFATMAFALIAPMILARTNSNAMAFGTVQSIGAIGGVVGGVLISAWGGFKRRIHGVLLGWMLSGLFGTLLIGLGRPDPVWMAIPIWGAGLFFGQFFIPLVNGSNQAIWMAKVSPDVQGKVFSIRRLIAWVVSPLANFIAGPLADYVLEPGMQAGGSLAGTFGWLVGEGPGAGMSLTFIFAGLAMVLVGAAGYAIPAIRNVETLLPDHAMTGDKEAPASVEGESGDIDLAVEAGA